MEETSNVPKLRFKEFNESWKNKKLIEFTKRVTRKNKKLETDLPLTISAQLGLIDQETFFNRKIASKSLKNYYLMLKGEFAYNKSYSKDYPFGAVKRLDNYSKGAISTLYICFNVTEANSNFLVQYFNSRCWYKEISKIAVEGARNHGLLNIGISDFFETKHKIPIDLEEQEKIAKFLNIIDKKIDLLNKKYESFVNFKKFFLQNLFSDKSKLRFEFGEYNGTKSNWKSYKLKDLGNKYSGLSGKTKKDFIDEGNSFYVTYKSVFDNIIVNIKDLGHVNVFNENQNKVFCGDLFFTMSSKTPNEVGMVAVFLDNVKNCYLNSFCSGFRLKNLNKVYPLFMAYYLSSPLMRTKIIKLAQGITRFNLPVNELMKMIVNIPNLIEQKKITSFLSLIDKKLDLTQNQIENMEKFKKGLLQQMFVYLIFYTSIFLILIFFKIILNNKCIILYFIGSFY